MFAALLIPTTSHAAPAVGTPGETVTPPVPDMNVQVTIRIWDAPPAPPTNAEGHTAVALESETGTLVIGQLDRGPAGEIKLPRPGVYEGHAWWEGRAEAADYYGTILDQLSDDSSEDVLLEAWSNNPVTERYVLDLAYVREPEPTDDEEL